MQFLDNYNYFGYLKGANEVNRQYFQQAVLLCLLKALYTYYARICSYAAYYAQNYAGIIRQGLTLNVCTIKTSMKLSINNTPPLETEYFMF